MVTQAHLRNTKLTDRTVWFDGDSSFEPVKLLRLLNEYKIEYVDSITPEIKEYNKHVSKGQQLKVKEESRPITVEWTTPEPYRSLDIIEFLYEKHITLTAKMSATEVEDRDFRLLTEIAAYKKRRLFDVLRAVIWLINTLTVNNVIWGVGRGSSVSSYVLYIIGVHDVDSYAYDLDIDDFLHE